MTTFTAKQGFLTAIGQYPMLLALIFALLIHILILSLLTFKTDNQLSNTTHPLDISLQTFIKPQPVSQIPVNNSDKQDKLVTQKLKTAPEIEKIAAKPKAQPSIEKNLRSNNHIQKHQAEIKSEVEKPSVATLPAQENPENKPNGTLDKPRFSADDLQQQIAQYGKQIMTSKPSLLQSKIKFVNTITNNRFIVSQYVKDWDDKVERTGNMNYPEAARNLKEPQSLTMDIGINADGSLYSIRIVKSSGNEVLDDAAKRIVRMSAPFAEIPIAIQQEVNVLVITRVWKFSDETGITTR